MAARETQPIDPPSGIDNPRHDPRSPAEGLDLTRFAPPSPDKKFDIPQHRIPPGMMAEWKALTIMGMSNQERLGEYMRAGWIPAKAEQFPEISGYGTKLPPGLLEVAGYKEVKQGDIVKRRNNILMMRPKVVTEQAHQERRKESAYQIKQQIDHLTGRSREEVGDKLTKFRVTSEQIPANV